MSGGDGCLLEKGSSPNCSYLEKKETACGSPKPGGSLTNCQPAEIPMDIVYLGTHAV